MRARARVCVCVCARTCVCARALSRTHARMHACRFSSLGSSAVIGGRARHPARPALRPLCPTSPAVRVLRLCARFSASGFGSAHTRAPSYAATTPAPSQSIHCAHAVATAPSGARIPRPAVRGAHGRVHAARRAIGGRAVRVRAQCACRSAQARECGWWVGLTRFSITRETHGPSSTDSRVLPLPARHAGARGPAAGKLGLRVPRAHACMGELA